MYGKHLQIGHTHTHTHSDSNSLTLCSLTSQLLHLSISFLTLDKCPDRPWLWALHVNRTTVIETAWKISRSYDR